MSSGHLPVGRQKFAAAKAFSQLTSTHHPLPLFFQPSIAYSTPF